jgi:hypothetical protein
VLVGDAIFCTVRLLMQWLHPGGEFEDEAAGGYEVVAAVGGPYLADLVNTVIIVGGFASCVAIQASTSRLLYAMGRDGVLPRRAFGYPRSRRGGGTKSVFTHLVLPALGAVVGLYLLTRLSQTAILLGIAWLILGAVYLCVLPLGLRNDPPELSWKTRRSRPLPGPPPTDPRRRLRRDGAAKYRPGMPLASPGHSAAGFGQSRKARSAGIWTGVARRA